MTTVTLVKDVPASNYYTGGAATKTITLNGVTAMIWNIKKSIIKIHRKKNKNNRTTGDNFNDVPDNKVLDLKNGDETLVIRGWLEDDATDTAWAKVWMIRAMITQGGPIMRLTIGDKQFRSSDDSSGVTRSPFMESLVWSLGPSGIPNIHTTVYTAGNTGSHNIARIHVDLTFVLNENQADD